ncbi:MAG: DedA family protein, partial [Burkholderiaceae bacterium]|nr:DedA family protein [Burkholderiaceae bacterium]
LGGMVSWLMGVGLQSAHRAYQNRAHPHRRADAQATPTAGRLAAWALAQLEKLGPKACLLAWLPVVGDVVCTLAGWLRMPWLACAVYMAIGKFARYLAIAASAQWLMS